MTPWKHARRSAETMGGEFAEHLTSHTFIDRTKDAYPQRAHRFLLHSHDAGSRLLAMAIPDGPDAGGVMEHHLRDDMGRADIRLADWFGVMKTDLLPKPRNALAKYKGMSTKDVGDAIAEHYNLGESTLTRRVCEFLAMPDSLAPESDPELRRFAFRHSMGVWLASECLGHVHEQKGRGSAMMTIGVREIAEMAIVGEIGGLPAYMMVARAVVGEPQSPAYN